ncbi:hypothetical protein ABPG74_008356 [Tetrahymena malaccensis]
MRQINNQNIQQIPSLQHQSQNQASQSISQKITDYLNDNNRLISQAYISQCHENYEQALECLDKLVFRMIGMMENADKNHKMRQTIYENREILSEMQIKQYQELYQANINKNLDQNYYLDYYLSNLPVKKQIEKKQEKNKVQKVYWTEQEKAQFKEALQKFGKKDLKKISEYIGTKKPIQVRSHMQKYFKRLEKEGKLQQQSDINNSGEKNQSNEEAQHVGGENISTNLQKIKRNQKNSQQNNIVFDFNQEQKIQVSHEQISKNSLQMNE